MALEWPGEKSSQDSLVTITLTPAGDGTNLGLVHERLARPGDRVGAAAGWQTHLERLECRLSYRLAPNFLVRHETAEDEYRERLAVLQSGGTQKGATVERGPGQAGVMHSFIGRWLAIDPDTPMGRVECIRHYEPISDGKFIRL